MRFAAIPYLYWLLALPLVVALGVFALVRRRNQHRQVADEALARRLAPDISWEREILRVVLLVLSLVALVIAMARPQFGTHSRLVKQSGVDIVVALDTSKSMLARDVSSSGSGDRLKRAKMEVSGLIDRLGGDRIGLVAFAGAAFVQCPLTSDYSAAKLFLRAMEAGSIPVGGTNFGEALRIARQLFENAKGVSRSRVLILLSDGEDHEGGYEKEVEQLRAQGAVIHAIGIGTQIGELIPESQDGGYKKFEGKTVMTRLQEGALKSIAESTGGMYLYSAAGDLGFDAIYDVIRRMKKSDYEARVESVYEERFQVFAFVGFLLLLAATLVPRQKSREKPATPPQRNPQLLTGLLLFGLSLLPARSRAEGFFSRPQEQVQKGNELFHEQHYDQSIEQYERAEQLLSREPRVHFNRGDALFKLGRFKEAREAFLRSTGSDEPSLKKKTYYNIGNTYLSEGTPKEAIPFYRKALELDPSYDDARFNLELAVTLQEQQKKQQEQNKDKQSDKKDQKDDKGDQEKKDEQNQDDPKKDKKQKDEQDKKEQQQKQQEQQQKQDEQQEQPPGASGQAQPEPGQLTPQQVKDLLDSMKENEKAFQMHRVQLPEFKPRSVEKDW